VVKQVKTPCWRSFAVAGWTSRPFSEAIQIRTPGNGESISLGEILPTGQSAGRVRLVVNVQQRWTGNIAPENGKQVQVKISWFQGKAGHA